MRRSLCPLVLLAVVALTVAGCGSDEPKPTEVLELEETLGFSSDGILERQSRVENRIRDCMTAQGFEYTPVDPFAQQQALTGKARLTEDEFIEQFGYGISTLFGRATEQADPNERVRRSLSGTDLVAYERALWGDNRGATFADAVDSGHFDQLGGCTKEASEAIFGGGPVLSTLVTRLDELDSSILEDQRMVRAEEQWAECMAGRGFRYSDPGDIERGIEERFTDIVGAGVRSGATPPPPGISYDRSALNALRRDEVAVANADLECEKRDITPVELVVRPQYEDVFRKQNRRLLVRVKPLGE